MSSQEPEAKTRLQLLNVVENVALAFVQRGQKRASVTCQLNLSKTFGVTWLLSRNVHEVLPRADERRKWKKQRVRLAFISRLNDPSHRTDLAGLTRSGVSKHYIQLWIF